MKRKASSTKYSPKKMKKDLDNDKQSKETPQITPSEKSKDETKETLPNNAHSKDKEAQDEIVIKEEYKILRLTLKDDTLCTLASGDTFYFNRMKHYTEKSTLPCIINFTQFMQPQCVLKPSTKLQFGKCLFTTFVYDEDIIFPIIKSGNPIHVFLHQESKYFKKEVNTTYKNCTYFYPKRDTQYGVFHPKLILLEFPTFLRVVVSSSNLSLVDWFLLSQVIWFQDFPLANSSKAEDNYFEKELIRFLNGLYNGNEQLIDICKYDFSKAQVHLISSINGRFKDVKEYGIGKIMQLQMGSKITSENVKVTFQTSSVGKIDENYLQAFIKCVRGVSPNSKECKDIAKHFQLQFPTTEYVKKNRYGVESADCIIMPTKYYESDKFPKSILHKLIPIDGSDDYDHNLFHAKVMICTSGIVDDETGIYVGSHNFSPSAWGKFEKGNSQLCINNYELGVWFPRKEGSKLSKVNMLQRLMFKYPPEPYGDSDEPFQFNKVECVEE